MFAIFQFLVANENIASVLSKISVIIFVHYVVYMKYENIIQNVADSPLKSEPSQNFSKSGSITSLDTADSFNLNFASFFRQFSSIA